MNLYSSLLSDMNVDYRDTKITPENIGQIRASLMNFTTQIEQTAKYAKFLGESDKKWLTEIVTEFRAALIIWIRRHESELILYEKEVEHVADNI